MPWWEGREVNYFPLIVPRVIPMAAVAWNRGMESDYDGFASRTAACERTRRRCFYPVAIKASPLVLESEGVFHNRTTVTLSTERAGTLRYTLDGTEPSETSSRYEKPLPIDKTTTVRASKNPEASAVHTQTGFNAPSTRPSAAAATDNPAST